MGDNPRRGHANEYGVRVLTTPWGHWYWNKEDKTVSYVPAHMRHAAVTLQLTWLNNQHEAVRRACSQAVTWQGELKPPPAVLAKEDRDS